MPWIERVRDLQPLDAALDVANPLLKRLVSAINPVSGIDGAVTIPITRYGTINNQPTPFGVGAKSSSIAASNALCSTISSIGAADSTIILVVYNHALIADANNHFAGGSYRSGSLTTAIQLSNGAGTHYWQALTGNGSINTLSSNEVLPVGLSVLAHTQRGGLISIYRNGVLKNSTSAANGNSNDTFCICDIDGPALPNSTDRAILLGLKIARALSASELAAIGSNPWQLFEKERIWVPVAAGGDSTIIQADGTSTAGSLGGSATAATTPTQASGTSTAASIAASATAAAAVTQADGASTAATLVGVASTGSTITQADGSTVASVLAGSATSSAAATQADGVSTAETLTGAGLTAGASSITPAAGTSTASTLAGSSIAESAIAQANGVSTAGTLTGTDGIASASIVPASGSTTAADFAASATAAAIAIAAAGASSAATLVGVEGSQANDLALILKILSDRQELNPATGKFTIYDNDGVSVLYQANAWADAAGTVPYSGGALRRIDALV